MFNLADLHMHSAYSSDGELWVEDLIQLSFLSGLKVISITDHNSVKGIDEAVISGKSHGIAVIPGIEIDCNYEGTDMHLLGYQINWRSPDFEQLEMDVSRKIMGSFTEMIKNLHLIGIDVDMTEVLIKAAGKLPTPELIAEVLLENPRYDSNKLLDPYRPDGLRGDMPYINFYLDYFAQGRPAYVKVDYMRFEDAVAIIRNNNGIPVIAHPGLNFAGNEEKVVELIHRGALGLEIFNNYHSGRQIEYFGKLAINHQLIAACGSDFHGKTKPLIKPGKFKTMVDYESIVMQGIQALRD